MAADIHFSNIRVTSAWRSTVTSALKERLWHAALGSMTLVMLAALVVRFYALFSGIG
ncbi:MAG TPA: hypothetical protein VG328_02350 [Stellaceae bacterium]|jgi:hypothetical protein|nr:hypothetical protein [Stellaceae bacterium]